MNGRNYSVNQTLPKIKDDDKAAKISKRINQFFNYPE